MGNCRVHRFTPNGEFLSAWGQRGSETGQLLFPTSIALDPEGNVYIADEGNRRVEKFSPDGQFLAQRSFALDPDMSFVRPHGLAVIEGRLYVADVLRLWVSLFGLS